MKRLLTVWLWLFCLTAFGQTATVQWRLQPGNKIFSTQALCDVQAKKDTAANTTIVYTCPRELKVIGPAIITWIKIADENSSFNVTANSTVRFGADTRWVQKTISGVGKCDVATFTDPAFGVAKTCQISGGSVIVTPPDTPASGPITSAWVRLGGEGDAFTLAASSLIRFGDGVTSQTKTALGAGTCSVGWWGSDPKPGAQKFCDVQVTAPGVIQIKGQMPVINEAFIPRPAVASAGPRVRALTDAEKNWVGGPYHPDPTDIGAFREGCGFSHMSFDDPIVYPSQPGLSHLHTFQGNDKADASSTVDSIQNTGNSTCAGGTLNRTSYWMPALIDIRNGQPIAPVSTNFYYKLGYLGVKAGTVKPFPAGLRMIAGNSKGNTPITSPNMGVECVSGGGHQKQIPNCSIGDDLDVSVIFPQCWDGKNLDSPDHASHMAYATGNGCPATHPVPLAEIALNVHYRVTELNSGTFWKLSSDNYDGPGGYSTHADWFIGWDQDTMKAFINNCLNGNLDCHNQLLGDGRYLY